jgi:hypothetical protein
MIRIRKSLLRRIGFITLLVIAIAALMVNVVLAATVAIQTAPIHTNAAIYIDADADGINDPEELVGMFDVYDGNRTIDFSWTPYAFASGVNGSYRVSLIQNMTPLGTPTWKEVVIGHHWASNYNGASYTMGPFDHNIVCTTCPGHFVVQPETYAQFFDPVTQTYEYEYTPIAASLGGVAATLEQSDDFVLEIFFVAPPEKEKDACEGESCADQCVPLVEEICQGDEECTFFLTLECIAACESGEFDESFGPTCDTGGGNCCQANCEAEQQECQQEECGGEPCELCDFVPECIVFCGFCPAELGCGETCEIP